MQGDQYEQDQNLLALLMFYSAKSEGVAHKPERLLGAKATGYEWLGIDFWILLLFPSGDLGPSSSDLLSPGPQVLCEFLAEKRRVDPGELLATPGKLYSPLGSPSLFWVHLSALKLSGLSFSLKVGWWGGCRKTWSDPKKWCIGQWLLWNIPLASQTTPWVWKEPGLEDLDGSTFGMSHLTSSTSFFVHKISCS